MTEHDAMVARVLSEARAAGVLAHHCPNSSRCLGRPGLPDLILLGERGLVLPEIKSDDGDTSAEQDMWLWTASRAGIVAPVWRRRQFDDGTVASVLGMIR